MKILRSSLSVLWVIIYFQLNQDPMIRSVDEEFTQAADKLENNYIWEVKQTHK